MLHHVLAADVEDDRQLRLHRYDVREVLVRADAEINASRPGLLQILEHVLKRRFIGYEVVRTKVPTGLREFGDHFPKRFIAELFGNFLGSNLRTGTQAERDRKSTRLN